MAPFIGEFEVDPSQIVEEPLLEKGKDHVFLIEKSERREPKSAVKENGEPAYPYINLTLKAVDNPSKVLFHIYSMSSKALGNRSSAFSYKKFLDKIAKPYTTVAQDLVGLRIVATVRHQGTGDEAQEKLDSVKGLAQ